jgi:hypothetical protein
LSAAGEARLADGFLQSSTDADSISEFVIQMQLVGSATLTSANPFL